MRRTSETAQPGHEWILADPGLATEAVLRELGSRWCPGVRAGGVALDARRSDRGLGWLVRGRIRVPRSLEATRAALKLLNDAGQSDYRVIESLPRGVRRAELRFHPPPLRDRSCIVLERDLEAGADVWINACVSAPDCGSHPGDTLAVRVRASHFVLEREAANACRVTYLTGFDLGGALSLPGVNAAVTALFQWLTLRELRRVARESAESAERLQEGSSTIS